MINASTLTTSGVLGDRLTEAGRRLTPQRQAVLRALASASGPLRPAELLSAIRSERRIGRATVFRTVDLLVRLGLAQRLEHSRRQTVYVACAAEHHHHLVCQACGSVADVEESVVNPLSRALERAHGFHLDHATLDFYGTCQACRRS